eukprot:maker-scaffold90_size386344-snap-gene-1.20 protein:Tk12043 transcript:maker-scaffold90_size386344-snap-gene-1.20-mRNA-1 annotation:"lps-induced tnf-alpha factor"
MTSKGSESFGGGFAPPPSSNPNYDASYPPLPPAYEETQSYQSGGHTHTSQPPPVGGHGSAAPPMRVVVPVQLGPGSANLECPNCHTQVKSKVSSSAGLGAWLLSVGCCVFGCIFGCCLIPFCIDSMKVYEHHCPSCNVHLGRFKGSASLS